MIIRKRGKSFVVDLGLQPDGKRLRITKKTLKEAEEVLEGFEKKNVKFGRMAQNMSEQEAVEFFRCKAALKGVGRTISDATEFFLLHSGAKSIKKPLNLWELADACHDAKELLGARSRYLEGIKLVGRSLHAKLSNQTTATVRKEHIESWLRNKQWKPRTQNSRLTYANVIFNWAVEEQYMPINPAKDIKRIREDELRVYTLTVEQAASLLWRTFYEEPTVLPYVVSGLFCGGRRCELLRSDMTEALIDDSLVIGSEAAKKRSRRAVELPDTAVAWLRLCDLEGSFQVTNWRKKFDRVKSHIYPWKSNYLRKTFISNHYAYFQNESLVKAMAGQGDDSAVIHSHYRNVVTRRDAGRFWDLTPDNVIHRPLGDFLLP